MTRATTKRAVDLIFERSLLLFMVTRSGRSISALAEQGASPKPQQTINER